MPISRLELVNIHSVDDIYDQIEGQLELDYNMGRNLDALYDVLSGDLPGPAELIWHDSEFSRVALGEWYVRVLDVLHAVAGERPDLTLKLA